MSWINTKTPKMKRTDLGTFCKVLQETEAIRGWKFFSRMTSKLSFRPFLPASPLRRSRRSRSCDNLLEDCRKNTNLLGAVALSKTTFSITILSIKNLVVTLKLKWHSAKITLSKNDTAKMILSTNDTQQKWQSAKMTLSRNDTQQKWHSAKLYSAEMILSTSRNGT